MTKKTKKIIIGITGGIILVLCLYLMFMVTGKQIDKSYAAVDRSLKTSASTLDSMDRIAKPVADEVIKNKIPGCYQLYKAFNRKYDEIDSILAEVISDIKSNMLKSDTYKAGKTGRILFKEKKAELLRKELTLFFALNNALNDSLQGDAYVKNYFDQNETESSWEQINFSNMPDAAVLMNLDRVRADMAIFRHNIWYWLDTKQHGRIQK